ncbi:MAG: alpha/beta fold hydrolase [Syntrophales bacterium]|nr:alpha/beta fold hydrolase [Syntrophales bacterium]
MIFYPEVLPANHKFNFTVPFEEITLKVDGAVLNAALFKAAHAKGVILYFHGNAGSLQSWGEIAPDFVSHGYDLFILDYRGFGKSTGKIQSEAMLLQDGLAAYSYLAGRYPEKRVIIYGRSIGTGVAVYIAQKTMPKSLILESPFFNMIDLAAYHYPLVPGSVIETFLRYPLRSDIWIKDVACPVIIFHGTKDDTIPYNDSERLINLLGSRGRLVGIAGGGHNDLADYETYHKTLKTFLE